MVPVAVTGLTDAVAIAAGPFHTCAVRSGGQVVCWGQGGGGRLGDGLSTTSAVPVTVSGLTDAVAVTAGGGGSCAVRANGALACWGSGLMLGDGSGVTSPVPVSAVGLTGVVSVAGGVEHACALQGDGEVFCWGNGQYGQVGNGRYAQVAAPVPVVGVTDAVSVNGSDAHRCAVRTTGEVACWGQNDNGSLGDGTTANFSYVPVTVGGLSDAVKVVVGHSHSCALLATGEVACWGTGARGELGNGSSGSGVMSAVPVAVTGLSDAVAITAGEQFTCALRQGGSVVCWGAWLSLGSGLFGSASSPTAVSDLSDAVAIGAHEHHACAVRAGGAVVCWGEGGQGQLGNGGTEDSAVPVPVSGLTDAVAVMPGAFHTCAVRAGGGVVCWGENSNGQLGTTAVGSVGSPVPVAVPGLSDATSGSSGVWHTCVRRATGALACWGAGAWGQLGNGTIDQADSPVAVVGLTDAVLVDAGGYSTCAIHSGGALSCWGEGTQGQLGDGGPWKSNVPVGVLGLSIPKTPLGDPCTTDGACAGNHCVDGVCCQSDCNRTDPHRCVACAAGTGACTPLPALTPCRPGSGDLCDLGGLCDGTSETCPAANTPASTTTECYTRQDFCSSVEPKLNCTGALTCPARTSWDACSSSSSSTVSLFGGIVTTPPLPSGGVEVTFSPSWSGTIAARRVKSGCPDKPGFDLLPENDTSGQGYYWEIKADPPITCAVGQMNCVNMQVCVQYDEQWIIDAGWGDPSSVEGNLQLLHGISPAGGGGGCDPTGNGWMPDTTIPVDTVNNVVCVPANTLSPFGLFIPKPGSLPTLHLPTEVVAYATSASGATVTYVATASDAQDGTLTPTCVPASGTSFAPGNTTVECTVVDSDSTFAKASFPVRVRFQAPGDGTFFGQPINADGSSIFKKNSTIPVKFRLTGASAGITNLVAKLYTAKVSNGVTGTFVEADTNVAGDGGNTFRYDGGQYIYNLSTKSMTTGTWSLRVDLSDGVDHSVRISLK